MTTSTYLELDNQTTGSNNNTWGLINNANFAIIETAIARYSAISTTGGTTILTSTQNRYPIIYVTGILTSNAEIIVKTQEKNWIFINQTSGSYTLTVKTASGTGVTVPQSSSMKLYCDGTNVLGVSYSISSISGLQTALNEKAPLASPNLTGTPTAPTANSGTNTDQIATTAFINAALNSMPYGATFVGAGGSEGGELRLQRPQSGSSLAGDVAFDVSNNQLRFFEIGGGWRGAFIQLDWLPNGINSRILTTSDGIVSANTGNVLSATAGANTGDVGTYVFARNTSAANVSPGSTIAGSSLTYNNANGVTGMTSIGFGTWRLMGQLTSTSSTPSTSLFLRIY